MFPAYREIESFNKCSRTVVRSALVASSVFLGGGVLLGSSGCLPRDEDVGRAKPTKETGSLNPAANPSGAAKPKPAMSGAVSPPARPDPLLTSVFNDDFERPNFGPDVACDVGAMAHQRWQVVWRQCAQPPRLVAPSFANQRGDRIRCHKLLARRRSQGRILG